MKITPVDCIPKGKTDEWTERRTRARQILIEAYDSGANAVMIADTDGEYPSVSRMRQIFNEESVRATRIIRQRLGMKTPRFTTISNTIFNIKVVAGKLYVEINNE